MILDDFINAIHLAKAKLKKANVAEPYYAIVSPEDYMLLRKELGPNMVKITNDLPPGRSFMLCGVQVEADADAETGKTFIMGDVKKDDPDLSPFDAYEIAPVTTDEDGDCMPHLSLQDAEDHLEHPGTNANVIWTLYGHHPEGGVTAIGDFSTYEDAAEVYHYVTGCPIPENEDKVLLSALPPAPDVNHYPWPPEHVS